MAIAIPMIVGSINTVSAQQLDNFTAIYGGQMNVDADVLQTRAKLFTAAGVGYEKMGRGVQAVAGAINGTNLKTLESFKTMFVGRVGLLRPVAGYEAQTDLWKAIGIGITRSGSAFPSISAAINSMDFAKLHEARAMFEALGVLAKGGSSEDILARMGESLEEAMQRLADILMEFKDSIPEGGGGDGDNPIVPKKGGDSGKPANIKFPTKMVVTLDEASIAAIKPKKGTWPF